jgi:hypothetical protein
MNERPAFETWLTNVCGFGPEHFGLETSGQRAGKYIDTGIEWAWMGWSARATSATKGDET